MLLTSCLAAVFFCFLAIADNVTPSIDNSEIDLRRTLIEVEQLDNLNENHHIDKRTLSHGTQYIGVGYNYLRGNPEGGKSSYGGIDPGILITKRHIKLSATPCSDSGPPEITESTHSSCVTRSSNAIFHGTKSYQTNLKVDASVAAEGTYGLASFAFSMSAMYEEAKEETLNTKGVVLDVRTVCNKGRVTIIKDLAESGGYSVDDGLAAAVCALPTVYNVDKYRQFLEDWGTHTMFEVELGTKTITRNKSSLRELFKYAMSNAAASLSASGEYLGYTASLDMNLDTLSSSSSFSSQFKETLFSFTLGSEEHPEPIGFTLEAIPVVLTSTYWKQINNFVSRGICPSGSTYANRIAGIRTNVEKALRDYPENIEAVESEDMPLKLPIVWPFGTYSLVMPKYGCPSIPTQSMSLFFTGSRVHDTEDTRNRNDVSSPMNVKVDFPRGDLRWQFCTKTVESVTPYDLSWPAGEYCILRKGTCPRGFADGRVRWDDEDDNNANLIDGMVPDGKYDGDTEIDFCCREDGHIEHAIYLPTNEPFILMMKDDRCQKVHKMNVSKQWVYWDDEDDNNNNSRTGSTPYDGNNSNDHKLYFCYYTAA